MDNITQLLGGDKLPPEIAVTLQEAFDKKVAEVREQPNDSLREEFARRYEHDKRQSCRGYRPYAVRCDCTA